jgi:hypothetical protein
MIISDFIDDLVHCRQRTIMVFGIKAPWPFPIVYGLGSSSSMVLGCPIFGANAPWLVKKLYKIFKKISDAKYWLYYRFHPSHRYHMIDTKLGYGYHERDDQLLYAAMACLEGYVQDCENSGCHDPRDEARAIMHWWKVQRPLDRVQHDKWLMELYSDKKLKTKPVEGQPLLSQIVFEEESKDNEQKRKAMWALEEKIHKDEQDFLHRLVDIRPGMWT